MARGVPTAAPFVWDAQAVAKVGRLWKAEKSASEIAEEMGHGLTRNAIIGVIRRNDLTRSPEQIARAKARDLQKRAKNMARPRHKQAPPPAPPAPAPPAPPPSAKPKSDTAVAREPLRLTLMELDSKSCRWIVTAGAPWLYCGHNVTGATSADTPYCAAHAAAARSKTTTSLHRATREKTVLRAAGGYS